jgi:hypothetical protein
LWVKPRWWKVSGVYFTPKFVIGLHITKDIFYTPTQCRTAGAVKLKPGYSMAEWSMTPQMSYMTP